jgi:hypothetical protein
MMSLLYSSYMFRRSSMGHHQASISVDVITYNFYYCKLRDFVLHVKFDMYEQNVCQLVVEW